MDENIFNNPHHDDLITKIIKAQKIHIKNQVESGASLIQIFDSWAGLLDEEKKRNIYINLQKKLLNSQKLGVEVICFPRNIKNYKKFCEIVNPNAVSIDYDVDPIKIAESINIPIQGGMDPKCLLLDKNDMLKNAKRYLEIFKNHKYIFNLGHGVLPETKPENVKILVDYVKDFK